MGWYFVSGLICTLKSKKTNFFLKKTRFSSPGLINCVFSVLIAEAESKTQQQLGALYDQIDKLQARLNEADANERMFKAKLDNAQHEVCSGRLMYFCIKSVF